jgi:hypothetical protein
VRPLLNYKSILLLLLKSILRVQDVVKAVHHLDLQIYAVSYACSLAFSLFLLSEIINTVSEAGKCEPIN